MDIKKFIQLRRYLYHLTDPINCESIFNDYKLKSFVTLAGIFDIPNAQEVLRKQRIGHRQPVHSKGNYKFTPRDQDPLERSWVPLVLEDGMTKEDFIYDINSRVFFWAKETDLVTHYKRYKKLGHKPFVLRVATEDLFNLNSLPPMFCHLNSGAPSHWTHGLPARGKSTFQLADYYLKSPSSVREVTFKDQCVLPKNIYYKKEITESFRKLK